MTPETLTAGGGELLPCPFCGGSAELIEEYVDLKYPWSVKANHQNGCFLMYSNVNRHRSYETAGQASAVWNVRTPAKALGGQS